MSEPVEIKGGSSQRPRGLHRHLWNTDLFFTSGEKVAITLGTFVGIMGTLCPGATCALLERIFPISAPDSIPPDPAPLVDRFDLEAQGYLPSGQLIQSDENLDEMAWQRPTGAPPPDDSAPERPRVSKAREIEERIVDSGDQQMASVGVADVAVASPTEEQADCVDYISVPYESLPTLAFKHRTTVEAIMSANGVGSEAKLVGRASILVPVPCEPDASGQPQAVHEPAARAQVCQRPYTVGVGDTLSAIARSCGVTVANLAAANGIDDPDKIFAGQKLLVPTGPVARPMDSPAVKAQESATIGQDAVSEVFVFRGARSEPPPGVELAGHYTVHPGVTVANLCEALGVTPAQLAAVNPAYAKYILKYGILYPGLLINLPKVDNLPPHDLLVGSTFIEHKVQEGDTVDELAVRYGTHINLIQGANEGVKTSADLKPGMTLLVPAFPDKMKEGEKIAEDGVGFDKPHLPVIMKGMGDSGAAGLNEDGQESNQAISESRPTRQAEATETDEQRLLVFNGEGRPSQPTEKWAGSVVRIPLTELGEGVVVPILGPDGSETGKMLLKGGALYEVQGWGIRSGENGGGRERFLIVKTINPGTGDTVFVGIGELFLRDPSVVLSIGGGNETVISPSLSDSGPECEPSEYPPISEPSQSYFSVDIGAGDASCAKHINFVFAAGFSEDELVNTQQIVSDTVQAYEHIFGKGNIFVSRRSIVVYKRNAIAVTEFGDIVLDHPKSFGWEFGHTLRLPNMWFMGWQEGLIDYVMAAHQGQWRDGTPFGVPLTAYDQENKPILRSAFINRNGSQDDHLYRLAGEAVYRLQEENPYFLPRLNIEYQKGIQEGRYETGKALTENQFMELVRLVWPAGGVEAVNRHHALFAKSDAVVEP